MLPSPLATNTIEFVPCFVALLFSLCTKSPGWARGGAVGGALAVVCSPIHVLRSNSPSIPTKPSLRVDELVLDMFGKDETLTCRSADDRNSL